MALFACSRARGSLVANLGTSSLVPGIAAFGNVSTEIAIGTCHRTMRIARAETVTPIHAFFIHTCIQLTGSHRSARNAHGSGGTYKPTCYLSTIPVPAFATLTITQHTEHNLGTALESYATN